MAESDRYYFLYFTQRKDDGTVEFTDAKDVDNRMVLPRHPETNDLDKYYLQTMLMCFDGSGDFRPNQILDAFPVLSLTTDKDHKFYKLSIERLRAFSTGKIEEDEYIAASVTHLFMKEQLVRRNDEDLLLAKCLEKVSPVMYKRDNTDTVECEGYDLSHIASYVPTSKFRRMKILKGWIEGALHYYEYSIMFFDVRFVGYDDFNENIIDVKSIQLCLTGYLFLRTKGPFLLDDSCLYYSMFCEIGNLNRNWLFTSPNNDNERDGKVMLFRNKELELRLERSLRSVFRKDSYRINEVFKWNRYADGGKFNDHFDTMFVNKCSEECSLYTLLIYVEVEREDNFIFLGDEELKVRLESDRAYIIPHWVKHRVIGTGMREFIKAEIIFKNKHIGVTYDQSIADAFDQSCYYMLQSVRHPQLKDFVSRSFNEINEARFYKTQFIPALTNRIFILKTISVPLKYYRIKNQELAEIDGFDVSYITDGKYYYFKTRRNAKITPAEAIVMLSMMHLDVHPKRMFTRSALACDCGHDECSHRKFTDQYKRSELDINETIFHWRNSDTDRLIDQTLPQIQFPSDMSDIVSVATIRVSDVNANAETSFYFAAYYADDFSELYSARMTEITASGRDGDYGGLNVDFIGEDKNIVKIRQSSFGNGVKVKTTWKEISFDEFTAMSGSLDDESECEEYSEESSEENSVDAGNDDENKDMKKKKKFPISCTI